MRGGRQFVTERKQRVSPWARETTVVRGGAENPRAEREKPARTVEIGGDSDCGTTRSARGETARTSFAMRLRVAEDPLESERRAIEIPKGECPPRSGSVQRDCIRTAGTGLDVSHCARRPSGYNLLHSGDTILNPVVVSSGASGDG